MKTNHLKLMKTIQVQVIYKSIHYEELSKKELETYKGLIKGQNWIDNLIKEYIRIEFIGFNYDDNSVDINFIVILEEMYNSVIALKGKVSVIMEKENFDMNFKKYSKVRKFKIFLNIMELKK